MPLSAVSLFTPPVLSPQATSARHSDKTNASASVTDTPQAAAQANDPQATVEIDKIELAALMNSGDAGQTMPFAPVQERPAQPKPASDRISGTAKRTGTLAWGSRSDVGLVREHNEDSFVVHFPLFAVADGMGGHEAGEVASTIAVSRLAETAPSTADDSALAAAIEAAMDELMAQNMDKVEAYRAGKKGLQGFFMGQMMKAAAGGNPKVISQIVTSKLEG